MSWTQYTADFAMAYKLGYIPCGTQASSKYYQISLVPRPSPSFRWRAWERGYYQIYYTSTQHHMNNDRVPPLVWYNRQHWVSKRDHPKPNPHSNNPGLFEVSKQATTDPHSWGWTELGQTDSCNLRDPGVIQLQTVPASFPGS